MVNVTDTPSSFAAIEKNDAQILILGSIPGAESLKQQRYYAHPRNSFWPIIARLLELEDELTYQQRCSSLIINKIALWDVLQRCKRQGSLDSNIKSSSIVTNNFTEFLETHQAINLIVFNGVKAEQVFTKYVLPSLDENQSNIARKRLPSTSPAHASMTIEQKFCDWQRELSGQLKQK